MKTIGISFLYIASVLGCYAQIVIPNVNSFSGDIFISLSVTNIFVTNSPPVIPGSVEFDLDSDGKLDEIRSYYKLMDKKMLVEAISATGAKQVGDDRSVDFLWRYPSEKIALAIFEKPKDGICLLIFTRQE